MPRNLYLPFFIIFVSLLAALLVMTGSGWGLRPYLLFLFIALCPGMAIVRLIHLNDRFIELVLAVALSLALGTLVAEILVLAKRWSPPAILAILIGISLTGASLQILNILAPRFTTRQ